MKIKKKILLILLIVFTSCIGISATALARAGGGSSGGGSSSGGSSSGSTGSHHYGRNNGDGNPAGVFVHAAVFLLITGGGTMIFVYRSRKAKRKSVRMMKAYRDLGVNWDYREIQEYVEKAYYEIQECWKRYDPSYASDYLSEELAERWNTQLQWMKIRREEIIQENVKLLSAVPVGVHNEEGEDMDQIWYLIHGKMLDYYRNYDTKEIIRGNTKEEDFYEYWLFIRRNGRWVLDEIRQKDEMDIREFADQ